MKYITILEVDNPECANVGTITTGNITEKFKQAIESHFDAELISYSFLNPHVKELEDCISAVPIDVLVILDVNGDHSDYVVELSETWLY